MQDPHMYEDLTNLFECTYKHERVDTDFKPNNILLKLMKQLMIWIYFYLFPSPDSL